jgi:hypothetical protein
MNPLPVNKHANKIAVYNQNNLPSLVFIPQKYAVEVYCAIDGSDIVDLEEVGYLSDELAKKDISGIDTTAFCATDGIILVGNKNGNVSAWEI